MRDIPFATARDNAQLAATIALGTAPDKRQGSADKILGEFYGAMRLEYDPTDRPKRGWTKQERTMLGWITDDMMRIRERIWTLRDQGNCTPEQILKAVGSDANRIKKQVVALKAFAPE